MMVPLSDLQSQAFAKIADLVIAKVLAYGGTQTGKPTGEVSAVETLIRDGFLEIAEAWDPLITDMGYAVDLHAVFVHSSPQVRWTRSDGSRGRCELADLLVVVDHKSLGHQTERRAVLVQAKLLKNGEIRLRNKEWTQYELLSEWPTFYFLTPGYDPAARDFLDESVCDNAQNSGEYGGIDLKAGPPLCVQEMVAPPKTTGGRISLGQLLIGMTRGSHMMGREARIGGADDWSSTVDELLSVTAALPITIASAVRRGHSQSLGMLVAQASYGQMPSLSAAGTRRDGPPSKFPEDDDDPGGPISTVRLTFTNPEHMEGEGA